MASFSVIGTIESIKYLQDSCLLFVTEYKKGYKKSDGEYIDDKNIQWKVIFKSYFKKYLTTNFNTGMLVEVKGEVLPYSIENGKVVDGVSVIGQTCNLFSYPRRSIKLEKKMMRESQESSMDKPNLEDFEKDDF